MLKTSILKKSALIVCLLIIAVALGLSTPSTPNGATHAAADAAQDIWDGTAASVFLNGDGTEENPYRISGGAELLLLSGLVNASITEYDGEAVVSADFNSADKYYVLTDDIYLNDITDSDEWGSVGFDDSGLNQWTAIGYYYGGYSRAFWANFDGAGHAVFGIYINNSLQYQGLFGFIYNGTVGNLGIEASFIKGNRVVGGIAGQAYGNITNCYNAGTVKGDGDYVGGIIGYSYADITNCYNLGAVEGGGDGTGGIIGYGYATNCHNSGTVKGINDVGGVTGALVAATSGCSNSGAVEGNQNIGGVAGRIPSDCSLINCSNIGAVDGGNYTGGVAGRVYSSSVINCSNAGAVSGTSNVGGAVGGTGGSVTNCSNSGAVSGNSYVGGTAGYVDSGGSVTNCCNAGAVSGNNYVGGAVGGNSGSVTNCYFLKTDQINVSRNPIHTNSGMAADNFPFGADGVFLDEASVGGADNALDALNWWVDENSSNGNYTVWETEDSALPVLCAGKFGAWTVITYPTEATEGLLTRVCLNDENHIETFILPILNGTDYTYQIITAAVCEADGLGRYTLIDDSYGEITVDVIIPALGHTLTKTEAAPPTCENAGNVEYWTCSVCGKHFEDEDGLTELTADDLVIPALGHDFGAWAVTSAPTTAATGTLTRVCLTDDSHTDTFTLPKLNTTDYDYSVVTAATYTEEGAGKYTLKATGYGTVTFDVAIPVKEYTVSASGNVPAGFFDGYVFGAALVSPVRDGYAFGGWFLDAACTESVTSVTADMLAADGSLTLYAKWTANPNIDDEPDDNGLSGGQIAAIVIGSAAVLAIAGFAVYFVVKKKRK